MPGGSGRRRSIALASLLLMVPLLTDVLMWPEARTHIVFTAIFAVDPGSMRFV